MTNTDAVKGFRDYTGEDAEKRESIRKILVETFESYGFEPAETPIVEYEEFVKGENENDEAVSDIFKLEDKGKRKLALRYEVTFPLKRIMKNKKLPYKRYQIGPVFRDEPISANRFRQFIACDADIIGVSEIPTREESEILSLISKFLKKLGIEFTILVNNRKLLNEILDDLKIKENNRGSVLRELDKLDKQDKQEIQNKLYKLGAGDLLESLSKGEKYFSKFQSYKEIIDLIAYCKVYGVEIKFAPSLARGLSYYNGTIFEVKSKIKETIVGGGSFNFNGVQCVGFGTGLERLEIISDLKNEKEKFLIVSLGQDKEAIKISEKLRGKEKIASVYYGKPSRALEFANSYNFNKVIFVGEKEIKSKKFMIKDMKTGKEKSLNFSAKF